MAKALEEDYRVHARTFDSLPTDYRLSVPYTARVVRIDGLIARLDPPVVTAVSGIVPEVVP